MTENAFPAETAACLLDAGRFPIDRLRAAEELYEVLLSAADLPFRLEGGETTAYTADTDLPDGLALSPAYAALCLKDYQRTSAFVLGLRAAIRAAQDRFPGERIRVLYAGTGPLATLALMQTPVFRPDELRFTMIDIHELSRASVGQVFEAFGKGDFIERFVCADAGCWRPPPGEIFHVGVAEVMQRALKNEPQVAVTRHLARLLHPRGILVPERISLDLSLFEPGAEFVDRGDGRLEKRKPVGRMPLGRVFDLTRESALAMPPEADAIPLPGIDLPEGPDPLPPLNILTEIATFGDIVLREDESGLTTVHTHPASGPLHPGSRLELAYRLRPSPGLDVTPGPPG